MSLDISYKAEPTAARFHRDNNFFRGIMGPIGSGKSVACTVEILARALRQAPNDAGVRKTRFAVIRNTRPELVSTTIKTWEEWVPPEVAPITYGSPITAVMNQPVGDGTTVSMEVMFLALDQPKDVRKLLSLELTGVWLNEARELDWAVVENATGRVGRYPAKKDGGPTWSGIWADTNPPRDTHWWHWLAETERPPGYSFFRQPGALLKRGDNYVPNPKAENVANLPLGYEYWLRQVAGKSEEWIRVYVLGEYGALRDGKPVYPEFNDNIHVATEPLAPMRGVPLYLGWDYGLTPSCIVGQPTPRGQLRILEEIVEDNMGVKQFARDIVKPRLESAYPGLEIDSTGDPAGNDRDQTDAQSVNQILREQGLPTRSAPTNSITPRLEAVRDFLTRLVDGEPGILLDPSCKMLRDGFRGDYHYRRIQSAEERYVEVPEKNEYSHPHDALQYMALRLHGQRKRANRNRGGQQKHRAPSRAGY